MLQIAVPSRSGVRAYREYRQQVDGLVGRINGSFATATWTPVRYLHRAQDRDEVAALYRAADIMVVTPIRDGMNLVAKEFVATRTDEDGVLVLSEMAGAAQELQEALIINPYDVNGFADALARAIDMQRDERRARMRALRRAVAGRNVFGWASDILEGLESLWSRPLHYAVGGWEETSI
jgi:trehalose 6-phosphate synthase/phosphatase